MNKPQKQAKPRLYMRNQMAVRAVRAAQNLGDWAEQMRDGYLQLESRYFALGREKELLVNTMQEAIDNCDTCRGETGTRKCARCQTFERVLAEVNPAETEDAPSA